MKVIVWKLAIIIALTISPALIMNFVTPIISGGVAYQYVYADKLEKLRNTKEKKIVLIGGSNVAFGFDSKVIEDSLGLPVINMGLHGGLGIRFVVETARDRLMPGDIVFVLPEYENFVEDRWLGGRYLANVVTTDVKKYWPYLNLPQKYICSKNSFHSSFSNFAFEFVAKHDPNSYKGDRFNSFGDYIGHYDKVNTKGIEAKEMLPENFNRDLVEYLVQITMELQEKEITMYVSFPCLLESCYEKKKAFAQCVVKEYVSSGEINIVGEPENYVYQRPLVYDTEYHLTAEGCHLRSLQLVTDYRDALEVN